MVVAAAAIAVLLASAGRGAAQSAATRTEAGYLHADAGAQTAIPGFTSTVTFPLYGEQGVVRATYRFVNAGIVSVRGGVRFRGDLSVGLAVSRFSGSGDASVTAQLPHPFFFSQMRTVAGTIARLTRADTMVAAEVSWTVRPARGLDVMVFAGPAYVSTSQDVVSAPRYAETYPFDTATLIGADSTRVTRAGLGFTAGLDLSYLFSRHLGLGGLVRISRATATFSPAAGNRSSAALGGVQASAGLRIRF